MLVVWSEPHGRMVAFPKSQLEPSSGAVHRPLKPLTCQLKAFCRLASAVFPLLGQQSASSSRQHSRRTAGFHRTQARRPPLGGRQEGRSTALSCICGTITLIIVNPHTRLGQRAFGYSACKSSDEKKHRSARIASLETTGRSL